VKLLRAVLQTRNEPSGDKAPENRFPDSRRSRTVLHYSR